MNQMICYIKIKDIGIKHLFTLITGNQTQDLFSIIIFSLEINSMSLKAISIYLYINLLQTMYYKV